MVEILFAGLGFLFVLLGWNNWKGDISSIHSYHRNRIRKEDVAAYGKWMGAATMLMGAGFLLAAALVFVLGDELLWCILPFLGSGLAMMIYAQYRFNKGMF